MRGSDFVTTVRHVLEFHKSRAATSLAASEGKPCAVQLVSFDLWKSQL